MDHARSCAQLCFFFLIRALASLVGPFAVSGLLMATFSVVLFAKSIGGDSDCLKSPWHLATILVFGYGESVLLVQFGLASSEG